MIPLWSWSLLWSMSWQLEGLNNHVTCWGWARMTLKKKKKLFEPTLNKSHDYVISTLFSLPAQRSSTPTTSTASRQPQRCLNLNHNHHHHHHNNNHNSNYDRNPTITMVSLSGFFSFFILHLFFILAATITSTMNDHDHTPSSTQHQHHPHSNQLRSYWTRWNGDGSRDSRRVQVASWVAGKFFSFSLLSLFTTLMFILV